MASQSVVIVRSSYSPYGGVEKVALDVITALLQNQIGVQLLTWHARKWPITHPKLRIISVGIEKGPRFLKALAFNTGVTHYLNRHNPECVFSFDRVTVFSHMHGGGGTHRTFLKIKNADSGVLSKIIRRLSPFHGYTLHVEKKGFSNPYLKKIQCSSSLVRKDILRDYGVPEEKLCVIPNGISWHTIGSVFHQPCKTITALTQSHPLDPARNYLLFLGSGFERKGLDIAIRGLAGLPDHYGLIVVGKGRTQPYRQLAKQLAVDRRLFFLGPQENGWKYCVLCKGLVLPSRYEPFGIAAAEANAMGIPVLISDKTGYMDWVEEGKNGVVLKFPASREAVTDAFSRLRKTIETPCLSPEQIRQGTYGLDHEAVMHDLLHDFLGIGRKVF
jgi:UDP-glucose:(heptosyl)LPS alpha-1,3-glucosyltransferase